MTRNEVIRELQGFAKEIGRTPSAKEFAEQTGIGQYKLPKYGFENYGQLVKVAGLPPNTFDKTKYDDKDKLCEMVIKIIREKKKWPSRSMLEIKHYENPDNFPAYVTFVNQLGLAGIMAQKVLEYAIDNRVSDDIISICKSARKNFEGNEEIPESVGITRGEVYLGRQHGNYKIGKARNTDRRREDITLLGAEPFEVIHKITTDDIDGVEEYWHARFASKRLRGEWFKLSLSDVKAFKRWKRIV